MPPDCGNPSLSLAYSNSPGASLETIVTDVLSNLKSPVTRISAQMWNSFTICLILVNRAWFSFE